MSDTSGPGLLAIDVGSSRVKLGWFPTTVACTSDLKPSSLPIAAPRIPEPAETLAISHRELSPDQFTAQFHQWLEQFDSDETNISLASVHADATQLVQAALLKKGFAEGHRLVGTDLPVEIQVEYPDKVGIDRLLNAVAINQIRQANQPAIVADLGTANTVDLITADGAFAGGAILPGVTMSARVLHESTSSLPHLSTSELETSVPAVGKSTQAAIRAGIYWGAVGAISELIDRMSQQLSDTPQLFVTGGDAHLLAPNLAAADNPARHIPHLVLAGIQLAAERGS